MDELKSICDRMTSLFDIIFADYEYKDDDESKDDSD